MNQFLKEMGLAGRIAKDDLSLFMDWLITQRIDLKDMEDEARHRLRMHTLQDQPAHEKTKDYTTAEKSGELYLLSCKHCRWFREAPWGEDKDCVELGSRGSDKPCYGFTRKILA